jgi:hypothetical protein
MIRTTKFIASTDISLEEAFAAHVEASPRNARENLCGFWELGPGEYRSSAQHSRVGAGAAPSARTNCENRVSRNSPSFDTPPTQTLCAFDSTDSCGHVRAQKPSIGGFIDEASHGRPSAHAAWWNGWKRSWRRWHWSAWASSYRIGAWRRDAGRFEKKAVSFRQ